MVIDVQELNGKYRGSNLDLPDSILPPPTSPDKGAKVREKLS